ncbi:hypothetical protein [Pantanalinema sp. GBBB05]|uniref:hypothetical protein n=1 Tax=Pantanalinema sp. GBBB05 TaxID=2604139 RepID=UPI001D735030|nr:DUF4564 domain-containing protein [Pantanalinema sp. GBBB05]
MNQVKASSRSLMLNMPWFMPILTLPVLVLGVFSIATMGQLTSLKCDRPNFPTLSTQGTCQLTATQLLESKTTVIPLSDLRQATVATRSNKQRKRTYQVMLQTKYGGEIPLTTYSSSGLGNYPAIAKQINDFLKNSQQATLLIQQDDRWFGYLVGGVFTLVGLIPWVIAVLSVLRRR